MKTESEIIFERFCSSKGISFRKIPETNNKTPDYCLHIEDYKIIVELTQFDINEKEKDLGKSLLTAKTIVYYPEDEKRIRQKVKDKSEQLKPYKDYPTILIFLDNRSIFSTIESDSIKYALYGEDEYNYVYGEDKNDFVFIDQTFGKGKTFREKNKDYISAVGLIKLIDLKASLTLFHNYFANRSLEEGICKNIADRQFKIIIDSFQQSDWIEIK